MSQDEGYLSYLEQISTLEKQLEALSHRHEKALTEARTLKNACDAQAKALGSSKTALRAMILEWEKMTKYGSPLARSANEQLKLAREAVSLIFALEKEQQNV